MRVICGLAKAAGVELVRLLAVWLLAAEERDEVRQGAALELLVAGPVYIWAALAGVALVAGAVVSCVVVVVAVLEGVAQVALWAMCDHCPKTDRPLTCW